MPVTNTAKNRLLNGDVDFVDDTLRFALYTNAAASAIDEELTTYTALGTTNEVSGAGYTAGGATLTTVRVTGGSSAARAFVTSDNITFTGTTWTSGFRYGILYQATGGHILAYYDFSNQSATTGETVQITTGTGATSFFSLM